ncbi:MAG TPA: GntR family transcriptional regulator [Gammaproteobacteria bacterium]
MKSFDVISRRPLHDEVADRLRDLITRGDLAPGERLNERVLTERFGISRTPLREAVKILSAEGLVTLLPNKGAVVATITRADTEDMFQVIGALEALGGELACVRATDNDIAEIADLHERMRACHAAGDLATYFSFNQRIHEKIIVCSGNRELADAYRRISVRIRRVRYMANLSKARWDQAMEEHEQILAALKRRDRSRVKRLLSLHLANKAKVVQDWLAQMETEAKAAVR